MKKLRLLEAVEATSTTGWRRAREVTPEIYQQCEAAGVNVAAVQFIAAEASMDVAKPDTPASVYALTTENQQKPQRIFQGKLSEVNTSVVESDRQIAEMIRRGEIDGIVVMSADPVKANQAVFAAAVEMKTPIVGTGEPPWRWWRQRGECGRDLRNNWHHQPYPRRLLRGVAV